ILDFPQSAETLRRMHKEYVGPAEADLLAADAIVLASPSDCTSSAHTNFLSLLEQLKGEGKLEGKTIQTLTASDTLLSPGAVEQTTADGRRLAETLRNLKP